MSETKTEAAASGEAKPAEGSLVDAATQAKATEGAADQGGEKKPEAGAEDKAEDKAPEAPVVPDSPDKYDFTLPDVGLKDEKGDPFQFDKNDPFVVEARKVAFDNKLPQKALTDLMGLYAKVQAETVAQSSKLAVEAEKTRVAAELSQLASKDAAGKDIAPAARIDALLAKVNTLAGDGASKQLAAGLTNAGVVKVVEKIVEAAIGKASGKEPAKGSATDDNLRGEARLLQLRTAAR